MQVFGQPTEWNIIKGSEEVITTQPLLVIADNSKKKAKQKNGSPLQPITKKSCLADLLSFDTDCPTPGVPSH